MRKKVRREAKAEMQEEEGGKEKEDVRGIEVEGLKIKQ